MEKNTRSSFRACLWLFLIGIVLPVLIASLVFDMGASVPVQITAQGITPEQVFFTPTDPPTITVTNDTQQMVTLCLAMNWRCDGRATGWRPVIVPIVNWFLAGPATLTLAPNQSTKIRFDKDAYQNSEYELVVQQGRATMHLAVFTPPDPSKEIPEGPAD